MSVSARVGVVCTAVVLLLAVAVSSAAAASGRWVGGWGASAQATFANVGETGISVDSVCPAPKGLSNETVRDVVSSSVDGSRLRVRLTNTFGTTPLTVGAASVAGELSGAEALRGTMRRLTFDGKPSVTVPAGANVTSDSVAFPVRASENLLLSIYVANTTHTVTEHWDAQQDSFETTGNRALTASDAPYTTGLMTCWMLADRVDVLAAPPVKGTVVALGDSITDGFLSDFNANARWPNDLARRLQALHGPTMSVTDAGIWGNEVLTDTQCCGVSTLKRINRDVFEQPNVRDVIFLEGINDIGCSETTFALCTGSTPAITAGKVIAGYRRVIADAHQHHVRIFGATLTAFRNSQEYAPAYWTPAKEQIREKVNAWIRQAGHFDGVIDFARATADPHNAQIINPIYDGGDHLHPNDQGYQAMADAINLRALL